MLLDHSREVDGSVGTWFKSISCFGAYDDLSGGERDHVPGQGFGFQSGGERDHVPGQGFGFQSGGERDHVPGQEIMFLVKVLEHMTT